MINKELQDQYNKWLDSLENSNADSKLIDELREIVNNSDNNK